MGPSLSIRDQNRSASGSFRPVPEHRLEQKLREWRLATLTVRSNLAPHVSQTTGTRFRSEARAQAIEQNFCRLLGGAMKATEHCRQVD